MAENKNEKGEKPKGGGGEGGGSSRIDSLVVTFKVHSLDHSDAKKKFLFPHADFAKGFCLPSIVRFSIASHRAGSAVQISKDKAPLAA